MKNKTRQALSWMGGIVATTAMAIAGLTVTQAAAAGNIFKFDLVRSPALGSTRRTTQRAPVAPPLRRPFNGEHDAGPQVLNTSNFPDLQGPLINVQ